MFQVSFARSPRTAMRSARLPPTQPMVLVARLSGSHRGGPAVHRVLSCAVARCAGARRGFPPSRRDTSGSPHAQLDRGGTSTGPPCRLQSRCGRWRRPPSGARRTSSPGPGPTTTARRRRYRASGPCCPGRTSSSPGRSAACCWSTLRMGLLAGGFKAGRQFYQIAGCNHHQRSRGECRLPAGITCCSRATNYSSMVAPFDDGL